MLPAYADIADDLYALDALAKTQFDRLKVVQQGAARPQEVSATCYYVGPNCAFPSRSGYFQRGIEREDLSQHEAYAALETNLRIIAHMEHIAERLRQIPLLSHDDLIIALHVYRATLLHPRLRLNIDGHILEDAATSPENLCHLIEKRLGPLATFEAQGRFQKWRISESVIWAPTAALALAKYSAFEDPSLLNATAPGMNLPEVYTSVPSDQVVRDFQQALLGNLTKTKIA
jgi:hypothetical protein